MQTRQLGAQGLTVSALGLGCLAMSGTYGKVDDGESVAVIRAALDDGITLIDTGDFYGSGHNELLIRDALKGRPRHDVMLSVKFGSLRDPASGWGGLDTRPKAIRNFLAYTLTRLGTDYLDIYRPSRLDPDVPIEETVGALADLVKAGYVRHIGLSEVGADTIRRAAAVHPICDVQLEYSLFARDIEQETLPACREIGIGITAYGILSRGLLSGRWDPGRDLKDDVRGRHPRFAAGNIERNLALVDALRPIAVKKGVTVAELAIAWVSAKGADIVPVVGVRHAWELAEALGATRCTLDDGDIAQVEAVVPMGAVAGGRFTAPVGFRPAS